MSSGQEDVKKSILKFAANSASGGDKPRKGSYNVPGRFGNFISSAFPYDAARDVYTCPAGNLATLLTVRE